MPKSHINTNPLSIKLFCEQCKSPIDEKILVKAFATATGKIGGSKTSAEKKKSSRENGKKGGRPKILADEQSKLRPLSTETKNERP